MNKRLGLSLAAVVAASAITPVVAADAATTTTINEVVVIKDGQHIAISKGLYTAAVSEGYLNSSAISIIRLSNGKYYEKKYFDAAIPEVGNTSLAIDFLASSDLHTNITPVEGTFENGQLVTSCSNADFDVCSID